MVGGDRAPSSVSPVVAAGVGAALSLGLGFEYLFLTCFGCPPRLVCLLALVLWPIGGALRALRERAGGSGLGDALVGLTFALALALLIPLAHPGLPPGDASDGFWWPVWVTALPLLAPLPFLVAHGYAELALYQRAAADGSAHRVYAWVLGGAALGAALGFALHRAGGLTVVLGAAIGAAGLASVWHERARVSARALRAVVPAALAALVAVTVVLDRPWLAHALAIHWQSEGLERDGYRQVHQRWGRFGLFSIREKEGEPGGLGLLNDIVHWTYGDPDFDTKVLIDALPFAAADPGRPAVVIGAGGGRQVALGIARGASEIRAVELEPAVIDYFTRVAPGKNRSIYLHPAVHPIAREGRAAVEAMEPGLGLVYVADAGAARYNQLDLLIDGSFLLTREALASYVARLAAGGVVASFTHEMVDPARRMLEHVEATFRAAGLEPWALSDHDGYVVIGARASEAAAVRARFDEALRTLRPDLVGVAAPRPAGEVLVGSDDRPLSQLFYAMSVEELRRRVSGALAVVGMLAVLFVAGAYAAQHRASRPGSPPRASEGPLPWGPTAVVGLLVGLNFALLEVYVVGLANRRCHEIFLSTLVGGVAFLGAAGLGGMLLGGLPRRASTAVGAAGAAWLLALGPDPTLVGAAPGLLAVLLATGTLFPSVTRAGWRYLVVLFVADALGAVIATVLGLGVPPLAGVHALGRLALACFALTLAARELLLSRWPAPPVHAGTAAARVPTAAGAAPLSPEIR